MSEQEKALGSTRVAGKWALHGASVLLELFSIDTSVRDRQLDASDDDLVGQTHAPSG
jgi:hypothetical protein